jgi:large subunit ribosomal protein L25
MKTLELKAQKRQNIGSKDAASLRKNGMVPCVMYGKENTIHFAATEAELKKFIYSPAVYFVDVNLGDEHHTGVMREIQYHPLTDKPTHIDFLEISEANMLRMELPVKVVGVSAGVRAGGKLLVNVRKLKVEALPNQMPDFIELDITSLNIGDKLRVSDLNVNGVTFLDPSNLAVTAVQMTRSAISAQQSAADEKKK